MLRNAIINATKTLEPIHENHGVTMTKDDDVTLYDQWVERMPSELDSAKPQ